MSSGSPPHDADERLGFVAAADALAQLHLTVDDLADPDVRSLVIRHEHPEFDRALREGLPDVEVDDESINPRLHLAMHEIVAAQLWDGDPPEAWETAARLLELGYERHEILHMLAAPVAQQIWGTLHEERPYDRDLHVAALEALPGSWEEERATGTGRAASRRRAQGRSPGGAVDSPTTSSLRTVSSDPSTSREAGGAASQPSGPNGTASVPVSFGTLAALCPEKSGGHRPY